MTLTITADHVRAAEGAADGIIGLDAGGAIYAGTSRGNAADDVTVLTTALSIAVWRRQVDEHTQPGEDRDAITAAVLADAIAADLSA